MEQKFKKDSWQWNFFQEYWKLVQAYYVPEDADEWWGEVVQKLTELHKKYKNDFAGDMIVAYANDLNRRHRIEQKSAKDSREKQKKK